MSTELEVYKQAEVAIANAYGIYIDHEKRLSKALGAVQALLEKAEEGMDEDTYINAGSLIKKLTTTIKTFNEERSQATRAVQDFVKAFTTQESALDYKKEGTEAYRLKKLMDEYAEKKSLEDRMKQEDERKRLEKERELNTLRTSAKGFIEKICIKASAELKENISAMLNSVSLSNYDAVKKELASFDTRVPEGVLKEFDVVVRTVYVTKEEKEQVLGDVLDLIDWEEFKQPYETEVGVFLHESIAKMPSIKRELEEIEAAGKKEKERLLKDKQKREEQEKAEREAQKLLEEQEAKEKEVLRNRQAQIQAEFEFNSIEAKQSSAVKAKMGYEIKLVLPAGIMDVVRFWASEQQWPMDEDKVMRMTIDRMKSFAEKEAMNDKFIESEFVEYKEKIISKV